MLISAVMPTTLARREWIPHALRCYQEQDYADRELIVASEDLDVIDLLPRDDPSIRFIPTEPGVSLGTKRNQANAAAKGIAIAHWDDDDWHAPWRLSVQIGLFSISQWVSASKKLAFVDVHTHDTWEYTFQSYSPNGHGSTLCYPKDLWRANPFIDLATAEDYHFIDDVTKHQALVEVPIPICVASTHRLNTYQRRTVGPSWRQITAGKLPPECNWWLKAVCVDRSSDRQ